MRKIKGIGLLELMLALAVISVLLVAATRYFSSTSSSQKVNAAAEMLQVAINASEDVRMSDGKYSAIPSDDKAIEFLIGRGLIPDTWKKDASVNPWGGGINVTGHSNPEHVTLILSNVPTEECMALTELMAKKGVINGNCKGDKLQQYSGDYSS